MLYNYCIRKEKGVKIMEEIKKNKDVECIYFDGFTLNFGPYDFSLLGTKIHRQIGDIGQIEEENQVLISDIRMSPQLAKALYAILGNSISQYEQQFGTIPDILSVTRQVKENE